MPNRGVAAARVGSACMVSCPWTPVCALILVFALLAQGDLVTYLLAALLVSVMCRPSLVLNNPATRYLGLISYSLYLSHAYAREFIWPPIAREIGVRNFALVFALQVCLAIVVAAFLHLAVERPFLRLKTTRMWSKSRS